MFLILCSYNARIEKAEALDALTSCLNAKTVPLCRERASSSVAEPIAISANEIAEFAFPLDKEENGTTSASTFLRMRTSPSAWTI
jgi:hypothetical protein